MVVAGVAMGVVVMEVADVAEGVVAEAGKSVGDRGASPIVA